MASNLVCQQGSTLSFTIYIDATYAGSLADGTYLNPYPTITEALQATDLSTTEKTKIFHVFPGSYQETISIANANNVIIEGGSQKFTLEVPSASSFDISGGTNIELKDFIIDGKNNATAIKISAGAEVAFTSMTLISDKKVLTATKSTVSLQGSSITSRGKVSTAAFFDTGIKTIITSSSCTGGSYCINSRIVGLCDDPDTDPDSIENGTCIDSSTILGMTIQNTTFSGFSDGALFALKTENTIIEQVTIADVPNRSTGTAGIYFQKGKGGKFDNITITGSGTGTSACSSGFAEAGIRLEEHESLIIDNSSLSSLGCAGIYLQSSTGITVSRSTISKSGRGLYYDSSTADVFDTVIDSSISEGIYLLNSLTSIDITTISNSGGYGIRSVNNVNSDLRNNIGNATQIINNAQGGYLVTGNGGSSFQIVISAVTFNNNGAGYYAIKGDAHTTETAKQFDCKNNKYINQPLKVDSTVLNSTLCTDN